MHCIEHSFPWYSYLIVTGSGSFLFCSFCCEHSNPSVPDVLQAKAGLALKDAQVIVRASSSLHTRQQLFGLRLIVHWERSVVVFDTPGCILLASDCDLDARSRSAFFAQFSIWPIQYFPDWILHSIVNSRLLTRCPCRTGLIQTPSRIDSMFVLKAFTHDVSL